MPDVSLGYLGMAIMVVVAPGPDLAVVMKNGFTAEGLDRRIATWTSLGVVSSLMVQGTVVALGIAAVILGSEVAFNVIKYAGTAYMIFLGIQALRSAFVAEGGFIEESKRSPKARSGAFRGYRQGFLSNITNPKVLAFYFSFLPQFVNPSEHPAPQIFVLAAIHAGIALTWLLCVVFGLARLEPLMTSVTGRRILEGLLGACLIGFGVALALSFRH